MAEHKLYDVVLPYGISSAEGMSDYAFHLYGQLLDDTDNDESWAKQCSGCRSLFRLDCTHVNATSCATLPRAPKRQTAAPRPDGLESYDFYACGHVFLRGSFNELITDARKPRFCGEGRGDQRSADLCPQCWTQACWGNRGPVRGVRLEARAPLRLRRERLLRQRRRLKINKNGARESSAPPDPNDDTTIKRRLRKENELKLWRVRGLMKGKVGVFIDEEFHVRRAEHKYKVDGSLY